MGAEIASASRRFRIQCGPWVTLEGGNIDCVLLWKWNESSLRELQSSCLTGPEGTELAVESAPLTVDGLKSLSIKKGFSLSSNHRLNHDKTRPLIIYPASKGRD